MEGWVNVNEIISDFKQKKSVSKHLALNIVRDFLKEKFNSAERIDLNIKNGILGIRTKESIIAQEILLNKEEIKNNLNEILKKVQKERGIDFSDLFVKEVSVKISNK